MKPFKSIGTFLFGAVLLIAACCLDAVDSRRPAAQLRNQPPPTNQATLVWENLFTFRGVAVFLGTLAVLGFVFAQVQAHYGWLGVVAAYLALNALCAPRPTLKLGVAAWTKVSDLWVPTILQEGLKEPVVEAAAFLDSGIVATTAEAAAAASGPGTSIQIPFLIDPNHADQLQQEDTAPEMRKMSSGLQITAIFNRVSTLGATALSGVISGVKPNGDILRALLDAIQGLRKRQRNRLVLDQLKGLFHVATTPAHASGAFRGLRLDQFLEDGATPLAANLIDSEMLLDAIALAGENAPYFQGGSIAMHSVIANALNKQDQIDTIRNSEGKIVLQQWKGLTVYISDLLVRAGGTSGSVYSTFICALGSIAMGDKPQQVGALNNPIIDVASLNINADVTKNNVGIYDRTRFLLNPQGAKWTGTPADVVAGPTNAEVAIDSNWALGANDVKNVRIVCVRSNG